MLRGKANSPKLYAARFGHRPIWFTLGLESFHCESWEAKNHSMLRLLAITMANQCDNYQQVPVSLGVLDHMQKLFSQCHPQDNGEKVV